MESYDQTTRRADPVLPIVHLNGTSQESLIEQRAAFYRALGAAERALQDMAPDGRDYYPEPGRMEKARAQHARRLAVLGALRTEIEAEIASLEADPTPGTAAQIK
jgi:hypothetical protein